jgi:hypothetical protein
LINKLQQVGIQTYNFLNYETAQPMVFAWMPALSIYFRDPDGHELEYSAPLPDGADPNGGILSLGNGKGCRIPNRFRAAAKAVVWPPIRPNEVSTNTIY